MDKIVKVDEVLTLCKLASAIGTGPAYEKWWKESLEALSSSPTVDLGGYGPYRKEVTDLHGLASNSGYLASVVPYIVQGGFTMVFTPVHTSPCSAETLLNKIRAYLYADAPSMPEPQPCPVQAQPTVALPLPRKKGCPHAILWVTIHGKEMPSFNRILDAAMPSLRNLADNVGWMIGKGASTSVDAVLIAVPVGAGASQGSLGAIIQQSTGLTRGVWSESQGHDVLTYTTPDIKLTVRVVRPSRAYPKRKGANAHGLGMESVTEKMEAILKELHTYSPERFARAMLELSKEADPDVVLHDECAKYIHEWVCMECKTIHPKPASVNLRCPTVRCPGILLPSSYEERRLRDMVDQQIAIRSKLVSGIADLPKLPPEPGESMEHHAIQLLNEHGICMTCGELYEHEYDAPFAHCGCGTSEWYHLTPHMKAVKAARE
jgi:hypothetical protein